MSRASKLTLFGTSVFAASTIIFVHFQQKWEAQVRLIPYKLSALLQLFARNIVWLIAGRSVQGLGVGMLSMTVPVFQCEISPGHTRGAFVSLEFLFLSCGYLAASWICFAFYTKQPSEISWRGPY